MDSIKKLKRREEEMYQKIIKNVEKKMQRSHSNPKIISNISDHCIFKFISSLCESYRCV